MRPFEAEEGTLAVDAPTVAARRALRPNRAVAGDRERHRIRGAGPAHGSGGLRDADRLRQRAVADRLARRDAAQDLPDAALESTGADVEEAVDKVLDLIRFRYIPNHVHPSAILQREEASLRAELLSRLKKTKAYKQGKDEQVFAEFANVAKKLVAPIARNLIEGSAAVEGVGLETPREWGDVAWEFALNLQTGAGDSFGTLLQGSGTQAHLMYLLIDFVDNSYGSTFGWRQASIWALEEPESFCMRI